MGEQSLQERLQGPAQSDLAGQGNHEDNGQQRTAGQDNSGHKLSKVHENQKWPALAAVERLLGLGFTEADEDINRLLVGSPKTSFYRGINQKNQPMRRGSQGDEDWLPTECGEATAPMDAGWEQSA